MIELFRGPVKKFVADEERRRKELRQKVREARDEGIAFSVIARAAGLSRERIRQLYAGRWSLGLNPASQETRSRDESRRPMS